MRKQPDTRHLCIYRGHNAPCAHRVFGNRAGLPQSTESRTGRRRAEARRGGGVKRGGRGGNLGERRGEERRGARQQPAPPESCTTSPVALWAQIVDTNPLDHPLPEVHGPGLAISTQRYSPRSPESHRISLKWALATRQDDRPGRPKALPQGKASRAHYWRSIPTPSSEAKTRCSYTCQAVEVEIPRVRCGAP